MQTAGSASKILKFIAEWNLCAFHCLLTAPDGVWVLGPGSELWDVPKLLALR